MDNKKQTHYVAIALVITICLGLITGCGNNGTDTLSTQTSESGDVYTIQTDYNVDDYVTLGEYKGLSVNKVVSDKVDDAEVRSNMAADLWMQACDNATVDGYPQSLYDELYEPIKQDCEDTAAQWDMDSKEFLSTFYDSTLDEYVKDYVDGELILEAIVKKENITLNDEEYREKLEGYLQDIECNSIEQAEETYDIEDLKNYALNEKVYDMLIENAKITEVSYEDYYGSDSSATMQ